MIKSRKSSLYLLIKHDIRSGILIKWKYYLPFIFIAVYLCVTCNHIAESNPNQPNLTPSFGDYLFRIFKGMAVFKTASPKDIFVIPPEFLFTNVYLAFLIIKYPFNDLSNYGKYLLMRSNSKAKWWISKCIWCCATIVTAYALMIITAFIFSCISHNTLLLPTYAVSNVKIENTTDFLVAAVFLPFLTSIAISLLELSVALFIKPVLSFIAAVFIITASAYYCNTLLIGNYLMVLRNVLVLPQEGVSAQSGFIVCGVLIFLCLAIGLLRFKKYDIFA